MMIEKKVSALIKMTRIHQNQVSLTPWSKLINRTRIKILLKIKKKPFVVVLVKKTVLGFTTVLNLLSHFKSLSIQKKFAFSLNVNLT